MMESSSHRLRQEGHKMIRQDLILTARIQKEQRDTWATLPELHDSFGDDTDNRG